MAGQLARGWSMARGSYAVLKRYPRLAVFPVISGAVFLVAAGLIAGSLLPQALAGGEPFWARLGPWLPVVIVVALYVLTAVAVFFNVALIQCVLRCLAGQEPSVGDGIAAAMGCLPQILGWALLAATVGAALSGLESLLRDRLGFVGDLIGGLFEVGWSVVTYFVLPVLAAERVGPITAVRRSSAILRSKWGESIAGEARFGVMGLVFFLPAIVLFGGGLVLALEYGPLALAALAWPLMALGVACALAGMVALQALNAIFQTGVYLYATTGRVPASLDPALVTGAFRPKG